MRQENQCLSQLCFRFEGCYLPPNYALPLHNSHPKRGLSDMVQGTFASITKEPEGCMVQDYGRSSALLGEGYLRDSFLLGPDPNS